MMKNNQTVLDKVISLMNTFGYEGIARFTVKLVNSTYHVEIKEDLEVLCTEVAYYIHVYSKSGRILTSFWIGNRHDNKTFWEWVDYYIPTKRQHKYIPIIFELFRIF